MKLAGCDYDLVISHFVCMAMSQTDSPRPITSVFMFERLRLANPFERVALYLYNKSNNPLEKLLVLL